ncbi:hypothetical protein VB713_16610 [Anabaena cylindrica UHCC 0172]|uniref:hypothetical protein n=1 Tax=Anabaena cylindrica TaxID=1165 RepID=UPI002B1ECBEB|nr:hypothetical protein [Anabaena cylindrica]MEA5552565.1 hypothetical protein [Anabaena cylindrica UHCC 0172]
MTSLEIAIAKIKQLPREQRNEVIKFIEFLEFKIDNISHIQEQIEPEDKKISFTEAAQEFIGCLDSNIEDLSYNSGYMEGFGK